MEERLGLFLLGFGGAAARRKFTADAAQVKASPFVVRYSFMAIPFEPPSAY